MKSLALIALIVSPMHVLATPVRAFSAALSDKNVLKLIAAQEEDGMRFKGVVDNGLTARCPCYGLVLKFAGGAKDGIKREADVNVKGFRFEKVSVGEVRDITE